MAARSSFNKNHASIHASEREGVPAHPDQSTGNNPESRGVDCTPRKRGRKGLGSLFIPANTKYIQLKIGEAVRESTHTTDMLQAERIRRERLRELDEGISPESKTVTVAKLTNELENDYRRRNRRSIKTLQGRLRNHVLPKLGIMRAVEISPVVIDDYVDDRRQEGACDRTINHELKCLTKAFRIGLKRKMIAQPLYVEWLPEPNYGLGDIWKDEQFALILPHLPGPINRLVRFENFTGWRVSDVQNLRKDNVDWDACEIRLDRGSSKNMAGHHRVFPFLPVLEEVLIEQRDENDRVEKQTGQSFPWFFNRDGKKVCDYRNDWYYAIHTAGIVGLRRHDFRATALDRLLKLGFTPEEVMVMIGWKSLRMLEYYLKIDVRRLHEHAAKLREEAKARAEVLRARAWKMECSKVLLAVI